MTDSDILRAGEHLQGRTTYDVTSAQSSGKTVTLPNNVSPTPFEYEIPPSKEDHGLTGEMLCNRQSYWAYSTATRKIILRLL